jgi:predicted cupin superfamily sugar epimerase
MLSPADVIRTLQLQPHPIEGGYFRETYRSSEAIPPELLGYPGSRSVSTAIYYMLTAESVSEMHLLPGDEVFHFYLGDSLRMLQLYPEGRIERLTLGPNLLQGEQPQLVVPGGVWQGSYRLDGPHGFTLLGATMAPGFDYSDYQRGTRAVLSLRWPAAAADIARLTPNG